MGRENVIEGLEAMREFFGFGLPSQTPVFEAYQNILTDALELLKEQDVVVHPESSCVMTYITDCCCDLCGVQLIREDNFCRCCGKRIEWEGR